MSFIKQHLRNKLSTTKNLFFVNKYIHFCKQYKIVHTSMTDLIRHFNTSTFVNNATNVEAIDELNFALALHGNADILYTLQKELFDITELDMMAVKEPTLGHPDKINTYRNVFRFILLPYAVNNKFAVETRINFSQNNGVGVIKNRGSSPIIYSDSKWVNPIFMSMVLESCNLKISLRENIINSRRDAIYIQYSDLIINKHLLRNEASMFFNMFSNIPSMKDNGIFKVPTDYVKTIYRMYANKFYKLYEQNPLIEFEAILQPEGL